MNAEMIYLFKKLPERKIELAGKRAEELYKIHINKVEIANTIICTTDLFRLFKNKGSIPQKYINYINELLSKAEFKNYNYIFLQNSTDRSLIGLLDKLKVEKNYSSIKFFMEKIFRSWFDDKARAFRIANSIEFHQGIPAILIQPYYNKLASMVCRCSTTGDRTDESNYKSNIHNKIGHFKPEYRDFLNKIESVLKKPRKVYFAENKYLKVCRIGEQPLTDIAYINLKFEYFKKNIIDKSDLIMSFKPSMFAKSVGYRFSSKNSFSSKGLPVSNGFAAGKLIFRSSELEKVKDNLKILVIDESRQDDFNLIEKSDGVIGLEGGITSHLAVLCRSLGKPAVVLEKMEINEAKKVLKLNSAFNIHEFDCILLDGSTGEVQFSDKMNFSRAYVLKKDSVNHLDDLLGILSEFNDFAVFKTMPIEIQIKIGRLNKYLKLIGLK